MPKLAALVLALMFIIGFENAFADELHYFCVRNNSVEHDWKGRPIPPKSFDFFVDTTKLVVKVTGPSPQGDGERIYKNGAETTFDPHHGQYQEVKISASSIVFSSIAVNYNSRSGDIILFDRSGERFIYEGGLVSAYCGGTVESATAKLASERKTTCQRGLAEGAVHQACWRACLGKPNALGCQQECPTYNGLDATQCD